MKVFNLIILRGWNEYSDLLNLFLAIAQNLLLALYLLTLINLINQSRASNVIFIMSFLLNHEACVVKSGVNNTTSQQKKSLWQERVSRVLIN